MTVLRV